LMEDAKKLHASAEACVDANIMM
jgi:hypothetical protein